MTQPTNPAAPAKAADKPVVAPSETPKSVAPAKAAGGPEHSHYEVLVDSWGSDSDERPAPRKGDVIAAADIGPHHKWAVRNGVVKGITAKQAAAKTERDDELEAESLSE
jgi:hypothetical protein